MSRVTAPTASTGPEDQLVAPTSRPACPHTARVAAFYGHDALERLRLKTRAYENLGFWRDDPPDIDVAGAQLLAEVASRAGIDRLASVLDVGCGYGAGTIDLRRVWGCQRVVGVDITEPMLAEARRQAKALDLGDAVKFHIMSATALDLPAAAFSHVIAVDCACHFASREDFFREAYRVLRPGGVLAIADTVAGDARVGPITGPVIRWLMRYWQVPAVNYYGLDGYRQRLIDAGFRDVATEAIGAHVFPGATAHVLSPSFLREHRKHFGLSGALLKRLIFGLLALAYRRGYAEYGLIIARK